MSFVKILKRKKEVKESRPCQQCRLNNQHASAAVALRRLLVYSKDQKDDIDYADGWWYGDVG